MQPEEITLNLGHDAAVPPPPENHHWGKIVRDPTVSWLASWIEPINQDFKYVFLAAGSKL